MHCDRLCTVRMTGDGLVLVLGVLLICTVESYRPVILMHGVLASYQDMAKVASMISTAHPGTRIANIDAYNDLDSVEKLWTQVDGVYQKMKPVMDSAEDGVNLICFSQGGVICRGILEKYAHNVHTFLSLSSPQAGQFGDTDYLKYLFPNYTRDHLYEIFYTTEGQKISVANYWNDPFHQDLYLQYCDYLPLLNNGSGQGFKANFERLQQLVLIGGPDDGVITPWQSSHFGFFDGKLNVVEMNSQTFYANDLFGLKSLDSAGGIKTYVIPGVEHVKWHSNQTVFDCCIEPWLN